MKKALILSGIPWNTTIQRHHKMAFFLSDLNYEVYFIESIPSSKFTLKKLYQKISRKFNKSNNTNKNVSNKSINIVNKRFINPMKGLFWISNKYQADNLLRKIGNDFDVVINYLPINTTLYISEHINVKKYIYDCVRDFSNWGGYPEDILQLEKKVANMSDLILVDSYYLLNKMKNNYPKRDVLQILPTVDETLISTLKKSEISKNIRNILYFGAVGDHIDVNILNKLSIQGYNIHIIGEVYPGIKLNQNINYHGFVNDLNELAKLIVQNSDAIIIPYKGNMDGVIPAKLMQCIATGLPVFINKFYDSDILKHYLYVYKDYSNLLYKIENFNITSHDKIRNEMMKFLKENSEENQFLRLQEELLKHRN